MNTYVIIKNEKWILKKVVCPYCNKEFFRFVPLVDNKKNHDIHVKGIKKYVDHLMESHELKVNQALNNELGINYGDLI